MIDTNIYAVPDVARARGVFKIEKYHAIGRKSGRDIVEAVPFEVFEFFNLSANAGLQLEANLLIGAGGTVFSNANAHIGAGNGTTAVSAAHTDLQGASKTRKAMDATFPSLSGQTLTWRSTFATGDANYSWEEMAVFNAAAAGVMLARALVSAPFTKTSALSVVATYTRTVS
jgi:hypothetical protein